MSDDERAGTTASEPPRAGTGPYLTRSRSDRVVSGVCGGLGRHFGVDPVVFRVVIAATTLLGGVGLLLYGLAWLLLPEEGNDRSAARRLMAGQVDHRSFAAGVLLVMGVAVFFAYLDEGFGRAVPLMAVSAIVLFLTWSENRRRRPAGVTAAAAMTAAPAADRAAAERAPAGRAAEDPAPRQRWWSATLEYEKPPAGGGDRGPGGGGDDGGDEPPGRGPRSYLAIGIVCLAVAVAGVLSLMASTGGPDIGAQAVLASVLAVLGAGMLVGTFFGRARLLLLAAVPVTVVLVFLAAVPVPLKGPTGERRWTPTTVAALRSPYHMKAGDLDLDLTRLDLGPAGSTVRVRVTMGAGNVTVTLPADARVEFRGRAGIGAVQLPNGDHNGFDVDSTDVMDPLRQPSRGTIVLDVQVGLGEVEVFRAAA